MNDTGTNNSKWLRYGVLIVFIAFVAVPVLFYAWPSEVNRWRAAWAMEQYAEGHEDAAIAQLQEVSKQLPNDWRIELRLAQWMAESDRPASGLKICQKVLDRADRYDQRTSDSINQVALAIKATCLQGLDRPEEALAAIELRGDFLPDEWRSDPGRMNNLAYFQALADRRLEKAAEAMPEVIAASDVEAQFRFASEYLIPLTARTVIASALVARRLDSARDIVPTLSGMIDRVEEWAIQEDAELPQLVYTEMQAALPLEKRARDRINVKRSTTRQSRDTLAVLLVTRALIYQDLGESQRSDDDRSAVRILGYDPDQLVTQLPDDFACTWMLRDAATYLDTYGFILFKLGSLERALSNLDLAVLGVQHLRKSYDTSMQNSSRLDSDVRIVQRRLRHTEAVLLYHRFLVLQEMEEYQRARRDARRIRSLGFEPGSHLN